MAANAPACLEVMNPWIRPSDYNVLKMLIPVLKVFHLSFWLLSEWIEDNLSVLLSPTLKLGLQNLSISHFCVLFSHNFQGLSTNTILINTGCSQNPKSCPCKCLYNLCPSDDVLYECPSQPSAQGVTNKMPLAFGIRESAFLSQKMENGIRNNLGVLMSQMYYTYSFLDLNMHFQN